MEWLTTQNIISFGVVLAELIGLIVLLSNGKKALDSFRQPRVELENRLDKHDEYLAADKRRIEALEKRMDDSDDAFEVVMQALIALLGHELHNGNTEEMQDALGALNKYLTRRR